VKIIYRIVSYRVRGVAAGCTCLFFNINVIIIVVLLTWTDEADEEEDESAANTAKNTVTPAVTPGSKERRKPFFRRVSNHHYVCGGITRC